MLLSDIYSFLSPSFIIIIIIIILKGSQAFADIASLVCVYWIGIVITSPNDIFLNSPNAVPCSFSPTLVPTVIPSTYLLACPSVSGPVVIPTSVVSITANAYSGCGTITTLMVASTVTFIGWITVVANSIINCYCDSYYYITTGVIITVIIYIFAIAVFNQTLYFNLLLHYYYYYNRLYINR